MWTHGAGEGWLGVMRFEDWAFERQLGAWKVGGLVRRVAALGVAIALQQGRGRWSAVCLGSLQVTATGLRSGCRDCGAHFRSYKKGRAYSWSNGERRHSFDGVT